MSHASSDNPRDENLVREYLKGNAQAFEVLFQRYQRGIFFFIRRFIPQKEKAEEVFQEVFMKVLERMSSFDAAGSFRAWLYTLCRNHCIDRLRYQARRPENPIPDSDRERTSLLHFQADPDPAADQKAYDRELAFLLDQALQNLPEAQRETFILKERGGLTFEEISQTMEVSVNTVKSRMRYALTQLRRALKNKTFVKEALR